MSTRTLREVFFNVEQVSNSSMNMPGIVCLCACVCLLRACVVLCAPPMPNLGKTLPRLATERHFTVSVTSLNFRDEFRGYSMLT